MYLYRSLMKCSILFVAICCLLQTREALATTMLPQSTSTEAGWISLHQFGVPEPLRLYGQIGERTLYLPIPNGMQPQALKFSLRISADVNSGFLELYNAERVLHVVDLENSPDEIEVNLADAKVEAGYLVLRLVSRLRSQDDICETAYVGAWLDIEKATLRLDGKPTMPTTVGEFFPPLLTHLLIEVPPPITPAQAEAALRLSAALTQRYSNQSYELHIVSHHDEIPSEIWDQPLARRIVIRNHPQSAVILRNEGNLPTLILQGEGQALLNQSDWLSSGFSPLGIYRELKVLEWKDPTEASGNTVTLAELGYPLQQVIGIGRMDISIAFSQADLGSSLRNVRVRLAGRHSAIETLASANLSVLFNGALIHSQLLSKNPQFDLYLPLPNSLLQRENTLVVRFDYTPRQGECHIGISPFTAQLWENSYLQFDKGQVLPMGFLRFPQSLIPEFRVTIDPLTPYNLRRAIELVSALQKISKKPLRAKWIDGQNASATSQAWLIIQSDPSEVAALKPPLELSPFRVVDINGRELLRFDGELPFAVLQAFEFNKAQVLLLSANLEESLMDQLLLTLKQSPNGWYDLSGDVYLIGEGMTQGIGMNVRSGSVRIEPLQPSTGVWLQQFRPYLFGAALLFLLALLVWLYPKLVRKQPSSI